MDPAGALFPLGNTCPVKDNSSELTGTGGCSPTLADGLPCSCLAGISGPCQSSCKISSPCTKLDSGSCNPESCPYCLKALASEAELTDNETADSDSEGVYEFTQDAHYSDQRDPQRGRARARRASRVLAFWHVVCETFRKIVDSKYFGRGIMVAILINTLSMGIEYHEQVSAAPAPPGAAGMRVVLWVQIWLPMGWFGARGAVGRAPGQGKVYFSPLSLHPAHRQRQAAITLAGTRLRQLLHPGLARDAHRHAETAVTQAAPCVAGFCGAGAREREQPFVAGFVPAPQPSWHCRRLRALRSVQLQAGKSIEFAVPGEEVTNAFASSANTPATAR